MRKSGVLAESPRSPQRKSPEATRANQRGICILYIVVSEVLGVLIIRILLFRVLY